MDIFFSWIPFLLATQIYTVIEKIPTQRADDDTHARTHPPTLPWSFTTVRRKRGISFSWKTEQHAVIISDNGKKIVGRSVGSFTIGHGMTLPNRISKIWGFLWHDLKKFLRCWLLRFAFTGRWMNISTWMLLEPSKSPTVWNNNVIKTYNMSKNITTSFDVLRRFIFCANWNHCGYKVELWRRRGWPTVMKWFSNGFTDL